jgi:hypothetical protein
MTYLRSAALAATVGFAGACTGDISTLLGTDPVPAHSVSMTATNVATVANGDSIVIQFTNTGAATAFVSRCGSGPLLLEQQVIDGGWAGGVQNFMCTTPSAPGPIELAPGATLTVTRTFSAAGRYRMIAAIGATQTMDDASTAFSNPFDVPR